MKWELEEKEHLHTMKQRDSYRDKYIERKKKGKDSIGIENLEIKIFEATKQIHEELNSLKRQNQNLEAVL